MAATFHAASETVVCVSPPWEGDVSTVAHLRVALNGQDHTEPLPLVPRAPQILDHTPRAGPTSQHDHHPRRALGGQRRRCAHLVHRGVLDDGAAAARSPPARRRPLAGAECRFGGLGTDGGGAYGESDEYAREGGPDGLGAQSEAYARRWEPLAIGGGEGLRAPPTSARLRGAATEQGPGHYAFDSRGGEQRAARTVDVRLADEHYKYRRHWTTVPATVVEVAHTVAGAVALRCISPAAAAAATRLHVSFNGHDFRRAGSANWTFYAPPTASAVAPPTGPAEGGSRVVVSGAGFGVGAVPFSAAEDAAAGVGGVLLPRARHWSRANGTEWDGTARGPQPALCLFGLRSVAANVTNGTVHCQSPRASDGGGAREETGVDAVRGAVTGAAALHDDGVLRLTDGWPRQAGQYLLPMASPEWPAECEGGGGRFCPTWPTTYFELAFDLLMEGRGGVSVSVGDVPESGLGELGGGVGLRLSFAEGLLRVWHRVELVHEQPLPGYWCQLDVTINPPEQVCRSDADGTFRPASVAWREDGLHVSLGGDDLLVRFPFGWAPLPGWRMALAARTGRGFGRQWVRAVALRTDARFTTARSRSRCRSTASSSDRRGFSWYGYLQPRAVSPACGPLGGGTVVNVTASRLREARPPTRRFGAGVVDGTVDAGGLLCVSPAATAPAAIGLTVPLCATVRRSRRCRHAVGFGYVNLSTHGWCRRRALGRRHAA